jgi:hypothetical protein
VPPSAATCLLRSIEQRRLPSTTASRCYQRRRAHASVVERHWPDGPHLHLPRLHVSRDVLRLYLQESVHDDAVGLSHHPLNFAREPVHHELAVVVELGVGDLDVVDVVEDERPRPTAAPPHRKSGRPGAGW